MTKYREILRLKSLNLSQQNIANSCNVSKKTVNRVLKCIWHIPTAGFAEQNGRNAKLNGRLIFDY